MHISNEMKEELLWWITNLPTQNRIIDHGSANSVIMTDASSAGWGARGNGCKIGVTGMRKNLAIISISWNCWLSGMP